MPEHSQVHLPLPETSSIRLLFIEPGAFAEPLKVRLEVFPDLETCPPFNALSYTWGDPKLVETISCNGTDVSIGKNLADALRRFRASTPNYQHVEQPPNQWFFQDREDSFGHSQDAIWADALCINQDDLLEKTHQVRLMRRIYQKAGRVLIWLGPDTGDFDDALWLTGLMLRNISHRLGDWRTCDLSTFDAQMLRNDEDIANLGFPSREGDDQSFWKALCGFYQRPWFCRIWVYQEVMLASQCEVFVGPYRVEWLAIAQSAWSFAKYGFQAFPGVLNESSHGLLNAAIMGYNRRAYVEPQPLGPLLFDTDQFEASKPVDKVFALFGVAPECQVSPDSLHPALDPDYRRSHTEVYRDVTRHLIERYQNLCILSYNSPGQVSPTDAPREESETLPTWVQDFNSPRVGAGLGIFDSVYQASLDLPVEMVQGGSENTLVLAGLVCGVVQRCGSIWKDGGTANQIKEVFDLYRQAGEDDTLAAFLLTFTSNGYQRTTQDTNKWHLGRLLQIWFGIRLPPRENQGWVEYSTQQANQFITGWGGRTQSRRFFITDNGYTGIGPTRMREGDIVVVLFGGKVPFILREEQGHFLLIGDTFTHGLSWGEAIEMMEEGKLERRLFEIH